MSFFDIKIDKSNFIKKYKVIIYLFCHMNIHLNDHFKNLLSIQKEILDEFFEKFV